MDAIILENDDLLLARVLVDRWLIEIEQGFITIDEHIPLVMRDGMKNDLEKTKATAEHLRDTLK
jgi:hypothetical protein